MKYLNTNRKGESMPAKKYSEDYKKKVIRLKMTEGIGFKPLSAMTGICMATLRKWHDEYYYVVMQEIAKESREQRNKKYKRPVIWHQY